MDLSRILGHLDNGAELIKQIEAEVGREFVPRAEFNAKNTELKALEKQVGDLNLNLDNLSKEKQTFDQTIAELNGKVNNYELASLKARIAHEKGIPYELANRLTGDDEAALRADAESLSKLVASTSKPSAPPLKSTEPANGKDDPYKALVTSLKGE